MPSEPHRADCMHAACGSARFSCPPQGYRSTVTASKVAPLQYAAHCLLELSHECGTLDVWAG